MGVSKSTTCSKTYKMWPRRRFKAIWLWATVQRVSERNSTLQEKCTREQIPWQWPSSGSASPSPGWRPGARSLKSSPSSRGRLRPPPCAPTCPFGQRSVALALCTPLKSACTFHRQRRTRRSAGWWSCAWWCSGKSTPRSPGRRRRWPPLTARSATARDSPLSQRRRRQTFPPEPSSSQAQHPASRLAARLENRWPRASPVSPRRWRRAASRAAAPGRAWWLCWCTIDLAAKTRTVTLMSGFELPTKSGKIPEQLQESTEKKRRGLPSSGPLRAAVGSPRRGHLKEKELWTITTWNLNSRKLELLSLCDRKKKNHKLTNAQMRLWKNVMLCKKKRKKTPQCRLQSSNWSFMLCYVLFSIYFICYLLTDNFH